MNITITHNGFHGYTNLTFRAPAGTQPGDTVRVSRRVAKRLNDAVCGRDGCCCGEHVATIDGQHGYVTIPTDYRIDGKYPQHS